MAAYALPVLYALALWWLGTGLILWLDGRPRRTFRWSLLGASVLALAALFGLAASSRDASVGGSYLGFTCGLVLWAWHEVAFLMGYVTGPRREACSEGAVGLRRFVEASRAVLHHELAILATAVLVVALTWGAPNQTGAGTFLLLWVMRLSAKLNLFLGVPNRAEALLPPHLGYLASYFAHKPINLLFPLSVTAATLAAGLLLQEAAASEAEPFEATGFTFLGTLMTLAVIEHWFLLLPLPDTALWGWALRGRGPTAREPRSLLRTICVPASTEVT